VLENDADRLAMIKSLGGVLVAKADGEPFWGIFESAFQNALLNGVDMESADPTISARTTDVSGLAKDSVLTVASVSWRLKRGEPDGTGMTTLRLRQV
jgi:hypothetical protein